MEQFLAVPLTLKAQGLKDRQISGYGSTFDNVFGSYYDPLKIVPGAFSKSLARHKADGTMPKMLWSHNSDMPIGVWNSMSEDDVGLALVGTLADIQLGNEVRTLLQMGAFDGLSIGGNVTKQVFEDVDGDGEPEVRVIQEFDLWEVSPTVFPRNGQARIDTVMSNDRLPPATERQVEAFLEHTLGYSRKESREALFRLRDEARARGGMPAEQQRDADAEIVKALIQSGQSLILSMRPNFGR